MEYRAFGRNNISQISQFEKVKPLHRRHLSTISRILPFRVNNYIIDELIDWNNIPEDPIFQLTFPQPGMLARDQLDRMEEVITRGGSQREIRDTASLIQRELNPSPAG